VELTFGSHQQVHSLHHINKRLVFLVADVVSSPAGVSGSLRCDLG
jgi:hypothetical protein